LHLFFFYPLQLAKKEARCDYGLFMGASAANYDEIVDLADQVVGLKMYLNDTFTTLKLDGMQQWLKVRFVMFLPTFYSLHHRFILFCFQLRH